MIYGRPCFNPDYLQQLSGWVWREQEEALHYGLKLQEETITEMLLLRMARECQNTGLRIKMFNRIEEGGSTRSAKAGNGADWEWYFSTPYCQVGFRVQAKVLSFAMNSTGNLLMPGVYRGLKTDGKQAKDLIESAQRGGYNPIYVFYNHPWISDRFRFSSVISPFICNPTDWGCSISSATFVKNKSKNHLSELIEGMVPWHFFFRMDNGCGAKKALSELGDKQHFNPDTPRPAWIDFLDESDFEGMRSSKINTYLIDNDLAGVAYFRVGDE